MKKGKFTHYGNWYFHDTVNDIYYQDEEQLKHFLAIIKKYDLYNFLKNNINIFLEFDNPVHTSFFDSEMMGMHIVHKHIEKYTVIHEFTHCLQNICSLMDWEDIENIDKDNIFNRNPKKYDIDNKYFEYATLKNSNNREPYVAYCDILNSFGFGCYARQLNSRSHIPAYYNDDQANYILESHSNYSALLVNNNNELINELPKEVLNIIKEYDKLIKEKLEELTMPNLKK